MSKIDNQNGISLGSYSKDEWKSLLKETAYRGFKINKISNRFKKGGKCTFENDHLINLISTTGKTTTVNMNKVLKKRDRWSFSRLVHNIRMLFPNSTYVTKFNDGIEKLAEILTVDSRPKEFHKRCQANLGNFAILPTDVFDQIIYAMPMKTKNDFLECIDHMKMFWKAPLGSETICGTIDLKKFANWVDKTPCDVFDLNLSDEDIKALLPYIKYLSLDSTKFNFDCFDLIGTCKNVEVLNISGSDDLIDDHLQYIFQLPKLKHLDLSNFPNITDDGFKCISAPNNLSTLDLVNCKITGEGLRSIKKLTNLTHLNLERSNITENDSIKHLTKLKKLECLTFGYSGLTREGFKHLEKLPSLKDLRLGGAIKDEDLEPIGNIINLRFLNIDYSHFTGAGLKYLTKLSNFQELYLRKCPDITNNNLNYILQMKKLRYLSVRDCQNLKRQDFERFGIKVKWVGYEGVGY